MSLLEPYNGPIKLLLAFDIGTTFSSVSYCILEPYQVPEILAVARFPAQGVARADTKVPSLLYYDNTGSVRAAGAEVLLPHIIETAQTEGWTKAEWWKLHLRPKGSSISPESDLPLLPSGKSAVDILTDFVKYLFDCSKTYIQECHPDLAWSSVEDSIEYILTYPGGWSEQKYLYYRAIERAGLVPSIPGGRLRVHMLTESEAGLHFCVSHLFNGEVAGQATRRGVVVIDAGGGIINLSTFSMTSESISYEEIAPAESPLQGSIFVSRRARALIARKLEGWEHSTAEDIARFTREFDQMAKPVIESDQQPAYVRVADRRTSSSKHNISSGYLKLSGKEVTTLFNDSVDAVIGAFERQGKSVAMPITTAFFVGGLSTNDWVWSRLQSYFTSRKISIHRPDNHTNKVVAPGAVLSRLVNQGHAEVARAAHGVDHDDEHVSRKTTLRDRLRENLARKYNLRGWFRQREGNSASDGFQPGCFVCSQGSLFGRNRLNQDQCGSRNAMTPSTSCTMSGNDNVPPSSVPVPEHAGQMLGIEEKIGSESQSWYARPSSSLVTRGDEDEETVITSIRATDVAVAPRRLPAAFYASVQYDGCEWRTESKRVSVNDGVIEWDGPIPLPSASSTSVCLEVYASFELQPMLGVGEQLRKLTVTVEQLLDHSAKGIPFVFSSEDGHDGSSILVTVQRKKYNSIDPSAHEVHGPHRVSR